MDTWAVSNLYHSCQCCSEDPCTDAGVLLEEMTGGQIAESKGKNICDSEQDCQLSPLGLHHFVPPPAM